jgi:ureidoacrylate peracid hydrolase
MEKEVVKISAKPEHVLVELAKSAVIVIDMQNAYLSRFIFLHKKVDFEAHQKMSLSSGGMFDMIGFDVSKFRLAINPLKDVLDVSRKSGLTIGY